jgi:hypothetical protein
MESSAGFHKERSTIARERGRLMSKTIGKLVSTWIATGSVWLFISATSVAHAGISVTVDPGNYTGQWAHDDRSGTRTYVTGIQIIDAFEGRNDIFVGGIGAFFFNVDPDGTVHSASVPAVGGVGTLTFNSVPITVNPVDFGGEWIISRVSPFITGSATTMLVPGIHYRMQVGGGNFAFFNFEVFATGQVTLLSMTDAAIGGLGSITFNTSDVSINPGTYAGSWQVVGSNPPNPIIQTTGSALVVLVSGVSYSLTPDRTPKSFPVTEPCSIVELDFVDYVFTVGCSTPAYDCTGFGPPMDRAAKVRKHRALPLKAELTDEMGFPVTDTEVMAAPVVEILFSSGNEDEPIDVTDYVLPVGSSFEGNTFIYDGTAQEWRFNLSTKNYTASGTYSISMKSGDTDEYALTTPTCSSTFVIP